jgi:hypothetical protein
VCDHVRRLRRVIARLEWTRHTSAWSDYPATNTYSGAGAAEESAFGRAATSALPRQWVWDLGANTGYFPLAQFVNWIAGLGGDAVIEFVSKQDAMVRRLLLNKDDQYRDYEQAHFESTLTTHFRIVARKPLRDGTRVLYHGVRRA